MKQKKDRYEMHKYWGKKPSSNLGTLIKEYTAPGDVLLDPFSGYGVFACEAYLLNRSIISNDLNPIASFINAQLLEKDVDTSLIWDQWQAIESDFQQFNNEWFTHEKTGRIITSVLRDKSDTPIAVKVLANGERKSEEIDLTEEEQQDFLRYEASYEISDWYPDDFLIPNSRISAKEGMRVSELFTKRTLACHARLLALIHRHSSGNEKDLMLMAFTSNLANCSKLVPPIKSRGRMAQGAWMTGFYVGPTYLENNVLHFFRNRLKKVINGKKDFLNELNNRNTNAGLRTDVEAQYRITAEDAKALSIPSESIDYVFTDPPYGEAVPYFEQSLIWNSWLNFEPNYTEEIVISNSNQRQKRASDYESEILKTISEISRVLKKRSYFSLTYHSLSGKEWSALTNGCIKSGFELVDYQWLVQKSFTPRQINRAKSIKGDVLVTLQNNHVSHFLVLRESDAYHKFKTLISEWILQEPLDTNEIFLRIMKTVFAERIVLEDIDLLDVLNAEFTFNESRKWEMNAKHSGFPYANQIV